MYGQFIREQRKAKKLTQHDLAMLSGCTKTSISLIENEHSTPALYMLERICKALELELEIRISKKIEL